ncbi:potassium voltage-gated channel subfamily KQT member 1-like [Venturia canescens]|uniref:potassium voltage-gated channel subfamily KQT member 1-like n=1 Tax=Venturia canescens TaxID=32260 RepID=UPI001C9C81FD|nr:potassium voltage-gated channel subfamily KQT member 1-like [Venturia canescens]
MRDRSRHHDHQDQAMPLEEIQGLLPPPCRQGNRGPLNVTIVQVGGGNGSSAGNDLLGLEPPVELKPSPSPLSETSATLPSDNNDTFTGGVDPRLLLSGVGGCGDRSTWEGRYHVKEHRRAGKATFQGQVYNFLERPTGWKCFLYHFSV